MERTRIDEIAASLDDIATALEEIKEHCSVSGETFDRMRQSIERATDAIDRMANNGVDPGEVRT